MFFCLFHKVILIAAAHYHHPVPAVFFATNSVISAAAGVAVALVLAFYNRGLLTVALGASAGVFITEMIIRLAM